MGFSLSDLDPTNKSGGLRQSVAKIDPTTLEGRKNLANIGTLGSYGLASQGYDYLKSLDPTKMTQAEKDALAAQEAEATRLRDAAGRLRFTPYNVTSTGVGGVNIDPATGMITSELSPELQALQQQYAGAAGPGGYQLSPELQSIMGGISGADINMGLTAGQQQQLSQMGMLSQQAFQRAGELAPVDINALAQQQYGNLQAMVAPEQEQARLAQENRLFAQGMLGSTGGSLRQQALQKAQAQQNLGLQTEALNQARAASASQLAAQGQLFGQGMLAGQTALGLEDITRRAPAEQLGLMTQQAGALGNIEQLRAMLTGAAGAEGRANLATMLGIAQAPFQQAQFGTDITQQELNLEQIRQGMLAQAAQTSLGAAEQRAQRAQANQMLPLQIGTQLAGAFI